MVIDIATDADSNFYFPPSLANDCLLSSGINVDLAVDFIVEYKKYILFLTTLAYLKDPPSDYAYPSTDILGELDSLASKIAAGRIKSQYLVDQALNQIVASAHEGHLYASFCSLQAISYLRPFQLVSVSQDGIQLPELYVLSDFFSSNTTAISSVVAINGQNATEVVEEEALFQAMDPDAAYNFMMASVGRVPNAGNDIGGFQGIQYNFYPDDYTNVTFSNGTMVPFENIASIAPGNWNTEISDGDQFTAAFCVIPALPPSTTTTPSSNATATSSASSSATATATPTTFPDLFPYTPVVRDPNNQVAGYFMNGSDYADTAVLWIATFEQQSAEYADPDTIATSFQNTTRDFFAALRASPNRTKLIIDLSGNPGGNTLLPDDTFRRLFPSIEPYGVSRFRVPVAGDIWGQTLEALPEDIVNITPEEVADGNYTEAQVVYFTSSWNYRQALTTDLNNFTGWSGASGLFPPNVEKGDNFTANHRLPLNETLYDFAIDMINVYGYPGQYSQEFPQPFPAENIVILTDGYCASACSIFTEFMTRQAGVKTIAVGGRPQNAPMQAIGGTKGALAQPFASIQQMSQAFWNASDYIPTDLLETANETFPGLNPLPLGANDATALKGYSINAADNIPVGDDLQIPLQFVFEPANCRIFYTPETVLSESALWEMAADIAWKGGKCAWGGMNTDVSNNGTGVGNSTSPGEVSNGAGAKSVMGSAAVVGLAGAVAMMLL
ncbi:uncharacterized protein LY89DRAFT_657656 [Mollisia scopiformis]|uniref:CPAF-like PDZ domain-containing protein n=1 Tax=Mollisia scopiformis TaxID=149040 RepID=A0A132BAA0_MOLSC|nr:uncharacterized protein LY89DRAFT_657656 [Mollisia scopiformis]KUJ09328.1 hypothetical protein LY89DRAFT_657656 [Mollisia scopiformis]